MVKYLGEQDANFDGADSLSSDFSSTRRDGNHEEKRSNRNNPDCDDSLDNNADDHSKEKVENLTKSEAMLVVIAQLIKMSLRIVLFLIICLFLLGFSFCYWYNLDAEIRSKVERQKKIVEIDPDFKVKWNALNEILLLKEKHDYLRSAFPSQLALGDQIDIGPIPKE